MSEIRIDKNVDGCWNCADALRNGYRCERKDCYPCAQYKAFSVEFSEKNFPNILVSQLQVLNDMLKYKEYYGATYQIKDILEILIKIPVLGILVILNQSIENEVDILDNTRIRAFYQRILGKALALGDWEQLAQEISNIAKSKNDQEIKNYCSINESQDTKTNFSNISKNLKEYADQVEKNIFGEHQNIIKNSEILKQFIIKTKLLHELYQCYPSNNGPIRVSTWRNQNLGHGATKTNLQAVTDELRELLKFLKFILDRTQYLEFEFNEEAIDQNKMKFIAKYHNDVLDLAPYIYHILDEEEGALLFESFNSNNNKAHLLDYCDSTFHYNGDLSTKLASAWNMCKIKNIEPLSNNSIDADYISEEDNEALEALDTVDGKIINNVFYNIFNKFIASNNKGVLLLTAERGMGKTVFAKDISTTTYSYYNITKFAKDNDLIWSYLINDSYSCTYDMFAGQLIKVVESALKVVRLYNEDYVQAKTNFEKSFSSNSDLNEKKETFCLFLVHSLRILKKRCQIEKFILVIDGLDEINYAQRNHLDAELFFDNVLPEDLYIVCLARNHSEVKNFGRNTYSGQYSFVEISRNDEIYRATLETYLKDKFGKYGKNKEYREKILALADNRLIYLETYKRIYDYNKTEFVSLVNIEKNKEESIIVIYLAALASDTGEKYVNELFRILVVLSYIKESITINELSILCYGLDCNYRTFDIMGKLFDLRGFLQIKRGTYGNHVFLSNEAWRKGILNLKKSNNTKYKIINNNLYRIKTYMVSNLHQKTISILNAYPVVKTEVITLDKSKLLSNDYFASNTTEELIIEKYSDSSVISTEFDVSLLLLNNIDIKKCNNKIDADISRVAMCILQNIKNKYLNMDTTNIATSNIKKLLLRALSTVEHISLLAYNEMIISFIYSSVYQDIRVMLFELSTNKESKNLYKEIKKEITKVKRKKAEPYQLIKLTIEKMIKDKKINSAIKFIDKTTENNKKYNTKYEEIFYASMKVIKAELLIKMRQDEKGIKILLEVENVYRNNFEVLLIEEIEEYSYVCSTLGRMFFCNNRFDISIKWFYKAIDVFEKILLRDEEVREGIVIFKDKDMYFKQYAYLCGDLGEVLFVNEEVDESIEWISKSINIFNNILSKDNKNKILSDKEKDEMIERFNDLKELFRDNEIYIRRSNIYKEVNSRNILNARIIIYGIKKNSNIKTDLGNKISENKYSNSLIKKIKDFLGKIKNNIFKRISK